MKDLQQKCVWHNKVLWKICSDFNKHLSNLGVSEKNVNISTHLE